MLLVFLNILHKFSHEYHFNTLVSEWVRFSSWIYRACFFWCWSYWGESMFTQCMLHNGKLSDTVLAIHETFYCVQMFDSAWWCAWRALYVSPTKIGIKCCWPCSLYLFLRRNCTNIAKSIVGWDRSDMVSYYVHKVPSGWGGFGTLCMGNRAQEEKIPFLRYNMGL